MKHLRNYRISTQSQKRNAENKGRPSLEKLAQNIDSLSQDEVTHLNSIMVNYKVDQIKTGFYQKEWIFKFFPGQYFDFSKKLENKLISMTHEPIEAFKNIQ